MEDFAIEFTTLLLFATPLLILLKILQMLVTQRLPLVARGSGGAKGELVAWLLLATLDSHTAALWSDFTIQPEDKCQRYGFSSNSQVYIDGSFVRLSGRNTLRVARRRHENPDSLGAQHHHCGFL
ncbi:hypothetical protein [Actinopolyspora mortivallis]|uniref:hypothetical protein n=1 Tax=Actinopolyspora mortivallis TaxID=33906 RepID=UPI000379B29B|nr:hypothetical protein [Actinopolyspora mortivallis]